MRAELDTNTDDGKPGRDGAKPSPWQIFPPLPDPIGFGGMFAGVSEDGLFAGGGSQFLEKPPWQGGIKTFSDRVYLLKEREGPWRELETRLPLPVAHSACTPYQNGVISAGGVNGNGSLRNVWHLTTENETVRWRTLPALPHPIVYGAACVVGDVLYVVGGVLDAQSTEPLNSCWALPLQDEAGWTDQPKVPGPAGSVMTVGTDNERLYVFGGMAFSQWPDGKIRAKPLNAAYCFDPLAHAWSHLPALSEARAGAASPSIQLPDGRLLVAGGYGFVFPGPPQHHPGFEQTSWLYSPEKMKWSQGPPLPDLGSNSPPGPEPMVTAPAVAWGDWVVLVSGEVRPGRRSPAVLGIAVGDLCRRAEGFPSIL